MVDVLGVAISYLALGCPFGLGRQNSGIKTVYFNV